MTSVTQRHIKPSLDDLPKRFVTAMKTLFDIMDDQKTGQINFKDIEARWAGSGRDGHGSIAVPNGLIESLQKVTPPNGMLTFERFCAGLKICLLRHRVSHNRQPSHAIVQRHRSTASLAAQPPLGQVSEPPARGRPSSVPLPDRAERSNGHGSNLTVPKPSAIAKLYGGSDRSLDKLAPAGGRPAANTATVRPNNAVTAQQRSVSVPHLQSGAGGEQHAAKSDPGRRIPAARELPGKLRGYRSDNRLHHGPQGSSGSESGILRFSRVRSKTPDPGSVELAKGVPSAGPNRRSTEAHKENRNPQQRPPDDPAKAGEVPASVSAVPERKFPKKKEPRRHTLGHGIEYSMLRRMKQLEQEKNCLQQGLSAVERAREWYQQRIGSVQDKMLQAGKCHTAPEYSMDAQDERLRFQMARILDVNQHLNALIDSSEKGFPMHMNLAVQPPPYVLHQNSIVQRLKEQNHLLTEEVSRKSEVIAQLEREKATLIRELFQARSQGKGHVDETTLM
ncbi:suppressor APC domain-containing protein 2 [Ixodes scapularis]|uniref:suppressor APC domain-containing protein 2 n=1 Tax=Ixodes scapularis TaxID=6945 RepID=UPI001A9DADA2|nr:suppressor APC domain-containing protein 2 [Ixodes scapularis]